MPYFLRKTRPRASYDLLEAFSPSCGRCGGHLGGWRKQSNIPRAYMGAWNPESRSIYHTRAGIPTAKLATRSASTRASAGAHLYPARLILSPLHPARPHPHPPHPHPHTRTPTPKRPHPSAHTSRAHTSRAHTSRKKKLKKNLTPLFFAPIVQA